MSDLLDWKNLGFSYIKTDYRFIAHWKDGKWDNGELTTDSTLHIHEGSTALHYGQQCFEGLKAYRCKDGSINLFRPDQNAKRMQNTCDRLLMPQVPTELFIRACKEVVKANEKWLAPYGSGATLYLRPFVIGVGENIGVRPAPEYIFSIFCCPVGAYFKGGMKPSNFLVTDYDRAAPHGTGGVKVGGNYAASLLPHELAAERKFADAIYLDPKTHTKIEEVGAANFFGITRDNKFITPLSPSILPSITKYSLLYLAKERLGMETIEGDVYINELDQFAEAGACGTAAVISPIGGIQYGDDFHVFYSETDVGPITKRLYEELTGIQFGDVEAPEGWIVKVD
ncbi:branched-chain amino acid aminotransferase [Aggregatibacter sp. oral taxon 513]|uniref:branched-chain amino acid aminotransferase n=1 Tax=Aggregatibacter sp. oral taxon 513 TaxID=712150 RepID=UPI001BAC98C7|nr:branched-chain amino acid aminotransferase [Aggregatibacter sp. oral taxon 513]QUC05198.1 branched-chain amino acid aminotransferase [Aggregatibacter sp. oral taxon 513]